VKKLDIGNFFGMLELGNIGARYVDGSGRGGKADGARIENYLMNIMKEDSNVRRAILAARLPLSQLFTWFSSLFDSCISAFSQGHQSAHTPSIPSSCIFDMEWSGWLC
jgi:hypothetical protein